MEPTASSKAATDLPDDYAERVYAGALGKVIGVYLGRPFEGWSPDRIAAELGEIDHYVHDRLGTRLVVPDDDISGTFTFMRALPDHGNRIEVSPAEIGNTWLNYLIDRRTILWWGGLGRSTEHTAYLRLAAGIPAPESGSMARNGQVVAEQIGAQIFIDGWAMVVPDQPALAADLARRAATVSHDGEAVLAAQLLAAIESAAFGESDIDTLLDIGLAQIPSDSLVARMIADIRGWHREVPDWREARDLLDRDYGYHRYGGGCHVIPNHGLIILALLYGEGDFDRSMMIVNTCGWDTDCNSGNLGCLLGIRGGLAAFDGPRDWRGPVADRMYLPTADTGRTMTDVAAEAVRVVNIGRALAGQQQWVPKEGARFHFELPGAVQGFVAESGGRIENATGHSVHGSRTLAVHIDGTGPAVVSTPTFLSPEDSESGGGYHLVASPTLYPSQTVVATVVGDRANVGPVQVHVAITHRGADGGAASTTSDPVVVQPGESHEISWTIPDIGGAPVCTVGLGVAPAAGPATVHLDRLGWDGQLDLALGRTRRGTASMATGWVDATDMHDGGAAATHTLELVQNQGRGLMITGTRDWTDYRVESDVRPHLAQAAGIAVRVQGLRRYHALLIGADRTARLLSVVDGEEHVLAEIPLDWELGRSYRLAVQVVGSRLTGTVDGAEVGSVETAGRWPLSDGGIALLCEEGRVLFGTVEVSSVS